MTHINYKACGGSEAQTRAEEEKIKTAWRAVRSVRGSSMSLHQHHI